MELMEIQIEAEKKAYEVEMAAIVAADKAYARTEAIRIEAEIKAELVKEEAARKATETLIAAEKTAQA